jgi:UDP-N-acetyl-D-mannosaminuronic acid dehydrogenase
LYITKELAEYKIGKILVVEPNIRELPGKLKNTGAELISLKDAMEQANTIAILVDHKEFKGIKNLYFNTKSAIDAKGLLE